MDLEGASRVPEQDSGKDDELGLQPVTDEEATLGRNALKCFQDEKFNECSEILKSLSQRRPDDPRVLSNLAVCKFYESGMTQPQDLVTSLRTIYGNIVQANGGGGLETGQELEFSILIFNVGVMTVDRKHFAVAEMILSRLYNAFHPTSGSSPTKDKLDQSSMVKEELLPLLITLNLLTKNTTKAIQLMSEYKEENQRHTLCRAMALVQSKSFKAFKRDFKSNEWSIENQITYDFLKAQLEFIKGNSKKANKLLGIAMQQKSDPYLNSLYQNNLSCLHLMLKKPNLAVYYVHQALELHLKTLTEMTPKLPHFLLRIKKDEMLYNLGTGLLHAGQPTGAFENLLSASQTLTSSPNYWLRLAECCINQVRKDEQLVGKLYGNPEWVHTKKVFRQNHKYKPIIIYDPNTEKTIGISKCQPSLTLDFAFNCLENAELLMSKNKRDPMTSGGVISESSNSVTSSPTKNGGSYSRSHLIMLSIWANKSYIHLCQQNYHQALIMAENILKSDLMITPAGFQTLAKMYAAEAQMYLANTNEALNLLLEPKKNNFHDMTFTENSDSNNTPNNDLASQSNVAKTIFQVNLAVAFILQGEADKAEDMLVKLASNATIGDLSAKVFSLRLYLALCKNHVEKARELALKHYSTGHIKLN